jgi:predicted DsbA family dithiol-disulfide isomerase
VLTLYHDFPSAASLVAVLRLQRLRDAGVAVDVRGFDVLGLAVALPATMDDLADWERNRGAAADLGWDLPRPTRHPVTLSAHLVGEYARSVDLDAAWRLACYRAHWLGGDDIGEPAVLLRLAEAVGLEQTAVAAIVDDRGQHTTLRQQMLVHRGDGVGGVPVLDFEGTFLSPDLSDDDLAALAAL